MRAIAQSCFLMLLGGCYTSTGMSFQEPLDSRVDPDIVIEPGQDLDAVDPPADEMEPESLWLMMIGGDQYESGTSIIEADDGDFIVLGETQSFGAGESDLWLIRLTAGGRIKWQKTLGGPDYEYAAAVMETSDNGIVVLGHSTSFSDNMSDYFIMKLDAEGRVLWQKIISGIDYERAETMVEHADGDIVIMGESSSFGAGNLDTFIVRLDSRGELQWQKAVGGIFNDGVSSAVVTGEGDMIMAGNTWSFGEGESDIWIVRLDAAGDLVWEKTLGTREDDYAASIVKGSDDSFFIAGGTMIYSEEGDMWLLEMDDSGNMLSEKIFGEGQIDFSSHIAALEGGGSIIAANANFFDFVEDDMWIARLDRGGNVLWQQSVGGPWEDYIHSILESNDGYILAVGEGQVSDEDPSSDAWHTYDMWIAKLGHNGQVSPDCDYMKDTEVATMATYVETAGAGSTVQEAWAYVIDIDATVLETNATPAFLCP